MDKSPLIAADAYRWVECTGSVELESQARLVNIGNDTGREEGKACHSLGQFMLTSHRDNAPVLGAKDIVGKVSKNGVLITKELYTATYDYVNDVVEYFDDRSLPVGLMNIETQVDLNPIYPGLYGFVDCWVFDAGKMTLTIWEAKFGRTIVEVFECWQMMLYASGLIEKIGFDGYSEQMLTVEFRIVQPRGHHIDGVFRSWTVRATDLRGYVNVLTARAEQAKDGTGVCVVGDHCHNCAARNRCATLQRNNYKVSDYVNGQFATDLSGATLGYEISFLRHALSLVKDRLSGLETQALSDIKRGVLIPQCSVKQGYGRERWRKDTPRDEVIYMAELLGEDISEVIINCTPKQAIAKGIDETVIRQYSETPLGELKLIVDDNSEARRAFSKSNE